MTGPRPAGSPFDEPRVDGPLAAEPLLAKRASGVLLHPTSLPGPHGNGDFGPAAYHFVDWLAHAGQTLWQVLPLNGMGAGNSPYTSSSAFAGNVLLIDLHALAQRGWLDEVDVAPLSGASPLRVDYASAVHFRMERLARAAARFGLIATPDERARLAAFSERHAAWLADYALYMALADHHGSGDWTAWGAALVRRDRAALAAARATHAQRIAFWTFCQWCFDEQLARLRDYAHGRGVRLFGDMPIFIAHQSAEVWARQDLFLLDMHGQPTVVAGVPPDLFSATGQRWGNPLYDWAAHAEDGYAWWIARIRHGCAWHDVLRIDHFRGFAACWEIPADAPTAERGRWTPGPGAALFDAVAAALGPLPIVAEDLGIITPDVEALRRSFGFPGMRILQFAFGSGADNAYLPHNHTPDGVVYTGTHDNDTTLGWWQSASDGDRHHVRDYLATDGHEIQWAFIRAACASVADTVIHPLQDVLGLGGEHRMNLPGQADGCWAWRFAWDQVQGWHAERLKSLCALYGRGGGAA